MERLKQMKECLISCVQSQISGDLRNADSKELGEAIDMIKDLSEAIYYCSVSKAMEEHENKKEIRYMYMPSYSPEMNGDRMYYNGNGNSGNGGNYNYSRGRMYYNGNYSSYPMMMDESSYPSEIRDYREGRSPMTRRNYMESKEMHQGKEKQIKELEKYVSELGQDITEMVRDSSPEEKAILSQKLNTLADKIR